MPDLHVSTDSQDGILIATVAIESLSDERVCNIVADDISAAIAPDTPNCILDMQNVRYCTSTGIGCMVRIHNAAAKHNGKLAIVNMDGNIADALKVARLDRLFTIAKSEKAARKALA